MNRKVKKEFAMRTPINSRREGRLEMTRRSFWIAALVLLVISCSYSPRENAVSMDSRQEVRLALIDQARWSMSAHNMQSWAITLDKTDPLVFRVYLANERLLPATDPYSRQVIMSVGGFLALIEDSAAARGYQAEFSLFPEGELPEANSGDDFKLPLAEVKLSKSAASDDPDYLDAISSATVKANLRKLALSPETEASFLALNNLQGIRMDFIQNQADLEKLKPILKEAFRLEMKHGPTLTESYYLMRRNARQIKAKPWGLSYGSGFPQQSLRAIEFFETLFPMKMEKWGVTGADNFDKEIDRAGTFLIIKTRANSRQDQILAGMLFQKVWLKAIHEGFAIVPASQPLQEYAAMADLYAAIHETFAQPEETIQMIAWLGTPEGRFRPGFRISTENLLRQ